MERRLEAKDIIRLEGPVPEIEIDVREVLRDLHGRPHLLTRVRISGGYFPPRAEEPFLLVGDVVSWFAVTDQDMRTLRAYFDKPLPRARRASFGYGHVVER